MTSVGAIVTLGLVIRVVYVATALRGRNFGLDSTWYFLQSGGLHDGLGFVDPAARFTAPARLVPTAAFPPLFPAYLVVWRWFGVDSIRTMQYLSILPSVATTLLTIATGVRVAGRRVGLAAGLLLALSPLAIASDASLMSETLTMPLVALAVYELVAWHGASAARRAWWRGAVAGLAIGAAMLTRADAAVLGVVTIVVLAISTLRRSGWSVALGRAMFVGVCIAAVALPWMVRNDVVLDRFTMTTRSQWTAFAGANCAETYEGGLLGGWSHSCLHEEDSIGRSEVEWADDLRAQGTEFVADHVGRLVAVVMPMRVVRGFGLFHPWYEARIEAVETRHGGWQFFAIFVGFATTLLAAVGLRSYGRSGERTRTIAWLVAAPIVASILTVMIGHANTRFRVPAEPSVAVGAAYAVVYWRPQRPTWLNRSTRRR